jgi:hypothetical protein
MANIGKSDYSQLGQFEQETCARLVDNYDDQKDQAHAVTIFHELLASDLPPHEKSYERLWQEVSFFLSSEIYSSAQLLPNVLSTRAQQ